MNLYSSQGFEDFQCFDAKLVEMKIKMMRMMMKMKMKAKKGIFNVVVVIFLNLRRKG